MFEEIFLIRLYWRCIRCTSHGALSKKSAIDSEILSLYAIKHTLGEGSAHDHAAHAGGGIEVLLARLAPAAVKVGVDLGHGGGVVDVGGLVGRYRRCRRGQSSKGRRAVYRKFALNLRGRWVWTAVSPSEVLLAKKEKDKGSGSVRGRQAGID